MLAWVRIIRQSAATLMASLAACSQQGTGRAGASPLARSGSSCDSARASAVVLDSLAAIDRFKSEVRRYGPDSTGIRIVTGPAEVGQVLDGAAIARVGRDCRIISLELTDSA